MKKFTLTVVALLASVGGFAQTTLWNGEDKELNTQGGFWGDGSPVVVENPEKDGVNPSDKCIKFVMTDGSKIVKLPFREWMTPSMNGSKRVSLMIRKTTSENVQIELSDPTDGTSGYWHKVATWYGDAGKWQKLVFDFSTNGDFDNPGIMTITAQTGGVDGKQEVFIDNIAIEDAPKVGGVLLSGIADNSLDGALTLSGNWACGKCINTEGDWNEFAYNDYATLNAKSTGNVTSIDMRGVGVKDVDINQLFKNPNTIVYADQSYKKNDTDNHENIVVDGNAVSVVLSDSHAFAIPENFSAASVKLTRDVQNGVNSFVLPFYVNADELGATDVATFSKVDGNSVVFAKTTHADANVPFITVDASEASELNFSDKGFVATPASTGYSFCGVYAPQSGNGLYGIDNGGKIHKGGAESTLNAFHAYLQLPATVNAPALKFDGEVTGIESAIVDNTSAPVYNLNGFRVADSLKNGQLASGLYVSGGKKIVVK